MLIDLCENLLMAHNERKTEDIVREHFRQYKKDLIIEEQRSDNPRITKLLSLASKRGPGRGLPEFIIQYKENPDFLILVECKADPAKHESKDHEKYGDYAVDGALLYSSYLSREYDVLAIAVSGETKKTLRVSHFLWLRGGERAISAFGGEFLSPGDYLEKYLSREEKIRQDYEGLVLFSKRLNEQLHTYKIPESNRALLISCVLIALENPAFRKSYKEYKKAKDLAEELVSTAERQLRDSNIEQEKLDVLKNSFSFIIVSPSLAKADGVLRGIITDIDNNINRFKRTHKYHDYLGQLYVEFLRYANSDKGLGIVLTPPHITKFMAELCGVDKNSVVYDNCAGTGGFLVSAMGLMIEDAKDNSNRIKHIKAHQLIGTEQSPYIFALACSNMFIHEDGKTNMFWGSCFDDEVMKKVKEIHPNIGLLNPPYKSDKKKDTEELEFVLNNLECLERGGRCAAIVPMSGPLAQKGKVLQLKKKLLESHTLEAVLSMPDELFFNSDVSVVSCILVFTANIPHPQGKKTFFGYFKHDGFVKRKIKGRIDDCQRWISIRENWIRAYLNKEDIPGLSVNRVVSSEDEWCAEAYMETNYSGLSNDIFAEDILTYTSFELLNKVIMRATSDSYNKNSIKKFNTNGWKYFDLTRLFDISASRDELMEFLTPSDKTPYVTSSDGNNGVTAYVEEPASNPAGTITANRGGSVGYFFYQPVAYKATPVDVRILSPKFRINVYIGLFLKTILQLERYRFNYSRKMGSDRLAQFKIKLPAIKDEPDWRFMEDYIKSLPYSASLISDHPPGSTRPYNSRLWRRLEI